MCKPTCRDKVVHRYFINRDDLRIDIFDCQGFQPSVKHQIKYKQKDFT